MIIMDSDVKSALLADTELISLLGGDYVWNTVAGDDTKFPRVIYTELNNLDADFEDDVPTRGEIYYQLDVFSKGSTSAIAQRVESVMASLNFYRYSSANLYEKDVKVYHRAMRYKTKKQI